MVDYFAEGIDPTATIEYWTPQIGQRVRVRLNGECQHRFGVWDQEGSRQYSVHVGHRLEEDGRTGIVSPWPDGIPHGDNHPVFVRFAPPLELGTLGGARMHGGMYAAAELELVTDEAQP